MEYFYFERDGYELMGGKNRLGISPEGIFLLRWMDGKTKDARVRQKFKERFGVELTDEDFQKFKQESKTHGLLAKRKNGCLMSKLSINFIKKQIKIFKKEKIRQAQYAGMCYSREPKKLKRDLKNCFILVDNHRLEVLTRGISRLKGIIVPHSNLELSGPCAAWAYGAVAKLSLPDLLVILAPDHSRSISHPFSILCKDFRTPLGLVKVDKDFIRILAKGCSFNIFADSMAHIEEHAVEIQLPFLQYIYRENTEKLRIVPILCAAEPYNAELKSVFNTRQEQFLRALEKLMVKTGKNIILVATGDLMHVFERNLSPKFHQDNAKIISLLKKVDAENFRSGLRAGRYTSCGKLSFYPFLRLLVSTNAKTKVLNYSWTGNSNFMQRNQRKVQYRNLVNIGYVSMIFYGVGK